MLPKGAFEYASASWHYDFQHERCPHDATFICIRADSDRTQHDGTEPRDSCEVRLLGNRHTGILSITYHYPSRLILKKDSRHEYGDLLIDEVSLSSKGSVLHELVFVNAKILIESEDITVKWQSV